MQNKGWIFVLIGVLASISIGKMEHVWKADIGTGQADDFKIGTDGNLALLSCMNQTIHLTKVDTNGGRIWDKSCEQSCIKNANEAYFPYSARLETNQSGYFVVTQSQVIKLNREGEIVWKQAFMEKPSGPISLAADKDGIVASIGTYLYSFSSDGKLNWSLNSKIRNQGGTLRMHSDRSVYVTGANGVEKYSKEGSLLWGHEFEEGVGASISLDKKGNVAIGSWGDLKPHMTRVYSEAGTLIWETGYDPSGSNYAIPQFMEFDGKGNLWASIHRWSATTDFVRYNESGTQLSLHEDPLFGFYSTRGVLGKNGDLYTSAVTARDGAARFEVLKLGDSGVERLEMPVSSSSVPWAFYSFAEVDKHGDIYLFHTLGENYLMVLHRIKD